MSTGFFNNLPDWCKNPGTRAKNLRMARANLGKSIEAIAKRAPIHKYTLSRYEDPEYQDARPESLYGLVRWYEDQGVIFGDTDRALVTEAE